MPLGFFLLLLTVLARLFRVWDFLFFARYDSTQAIDEEAPLGSE
jgi:hypothetical protein